MKDDSQRVPFAGSNLAYSVTEIDPIFASRAQRVHQNDLVGYLQEQGGFEVLNLPAIATKTDTYDLGLGRSYTRLQGELLHPAHESVDTLGVQTN